MSERYGWSTKGHDRDLLNRCGTLSKSPPRSARSGTPSLTHPNVAGLALKDETSTGSTDIKYDA